MVRSGHTCQIYEAMDDFDHKKFAIKALVPEQRKNKEEIKALQHELAVAKDFDHDNVIEVYEIGTDGSVYFLVLELSPHPNLKLMIRNDFEMALYRAPTIIEQVFISLGYMNDQGWVHSDVKPDNFLVSNEGDIKLIDFAISEKIRTGFSRWFASKPRIQGTMSYMSPEQIRG
ncbi:MAG TPA: serine/threonine protein kinase, partial [Planctomycetaceae bacterium]|nr:serine/threonine protein kinase [Planctomycetaceae bacterium]